MNETLIPGKAIEIADGIRRLLAPNAGMMTGPGTNTYLLGKNFIAVIDPGPLIPEHNAAIESEAGAPINWILCTHTHPDHSPAARSLEIQKKSTGLCNRLFSFSHTRLNSISGGR